MSAGRALVMPITKKCEMGQEFRAGARHHEYEIGASAACAVTAPSRNTAS